MMRQVIFPLVLGLLLSACSNDDQKKKSEPSLDAVAPDLATHVAETFDIDDLTTPEDRSLFDDTTEPLDQGTTPPPDIPEVPLESCSFDYDFAPWQPASDFQVVPPPIDYTASPVDPIAHLDPAAPTTHLVAAQGARDDIVMPDFHDNMPLFERARDWQGQSRCYELPDGPAMLSEAEAYDLYRAIVEETLLVPMDQAPGVRTVVGLRGASPGTFQWNGNGPNRYNDTLVLLWREADQTPRVKEFAAHTDTGPYDFGWHNSSSLKPNRHYRYINGWHKNYNALQIVEVGYEVRDDTNKNGHWDSDRNGWLPPTGPELDDHDRVGSAHNIHCATVDGPLGNAAVANLSAGCQVVPGIASWTEFITSAWTGSGDEVDYFLLDVRDLDGRAFSPCTADGSPECPYVLTSLPAQVSGDTVTAVSSTFDQYNCSLANESGPEHLYVFTLQETATVRATVDDTSPAPPDIDVHLLYGNSPKACLARGDTELTATVPPGRYYLVADTFFDGQPLVGKYQVELWLEPVF
jgi:hypothetical protein